MNIVRLTCSILVCLCLLDSSNLQLGAYATEKPPRPNIILIFVDDLGYGDLGCYGNQQIATPNIDALASSGQRWTSFYASGSVCVPSRRGLMSGRHPDLIRKLDWTQIRHQLMPAMLKDQGYATAILGKWHLAGYPKDFANSPMHPLECGFDYHYGTPGSNDVPAPPGTIQNRALFDRCDALTFPVSLFHGRKLLEKPTNQKRLIQRYTEQAVGWIRENHQQPMFLYLAHNMPHAPVFCSDAFAGRSKAGRYGDVVEEIDWSVGQVVKTIDALKIRRETLIVFTSDNGPWSMFGPHGGSAGPLRGEKGTSWEGGYRVPGIFSWPGRISPGTIDAMGANLDLYATFAKLSGGSEPRQTTGYDSMDLSRVLLDGEAGPRSSWLYQTGGLAFRHGNYKIQLRTKKRSSNPDTRKREPIAEHNPPLLFDLSKDIGEQNDIAANHPAVVDDLLRRMKQYQSNGSN